jgi:large subunit ribosomal protein L18
MAYNKQRSRRHNRVRAKVEGSTERPRLVVFRSNIGIYGQIIDDVTRKTIASVAPIELKDQKMAKVAQAEKLGKMIAEKALAAKINTVVFDRGGYQYHGRIKAFADAARAGGLVF